MAKTTKGGPESTNQNPTPEDQFDYSQYAGAGHENVQSKDLGVPFLSIVQSKSPQFDTTSPRYAQKGIPGCRPGDIFNSLTNIILPAPIKFIPAGIQKAFVEWKSRDSGGGFVKAHEDERILMETHKNERKQDILKNGNLIATTMYFFGFLLDENDLRSQMVIGMTSTQLKAARQWLNLQMALKMRAPDGSSYTPPAFSHFYHIKTVLQVKDQNSWFGWDISMGGQVRDQALLTEAHNVSKQVASKALLAAPIEPEEADEDVAAKHV